VRALRLSHNNLSRVANKGQTNLRGSQFNHGAHVKSNPNSAVRYDMHQNGSIVVVVRRRCGDKQRAIYRVEDIAGLHMQEVNGAVAKRSELHGYVWCNALLQGELAHECARGSGAHRLKVCVLRKDNPPAVYQQLLDRIGEA